MNAISLTNLETASIISILQGDASDPVRLVRSIGYDPKTFFMFGNWEYADFRYSDVYGVSFFGSYITNAIFDPSQIDAVLATKPIATSKPRILARGAKKSLSSKDLRIRLIGPLKLVSKQGDDLTPAGQKTRGLLALLATSPEYTRSRTWLQEKLWSDRGQEQGRSSLRQAISQLRKGLGDYRDALISNKNELRLDPELVSVDIENPNPVEASRVDGEYNLLDGLDVKDEAFEEWLREIRLQFAADQDRFLKVDR